MKLHRHQNNSQYHSKSMLQEWAQGQGLPLPRYVEIERKGPDHAPVFTTEVSIDGKRPARGSGWRTARRAFPFPSPPWRTRAGR